MTFTSSIDDCRLAIPLGLKVYVKNAMGDWIEVQSVNADGSAVVADSLSGFNDDTIGQLMTADNPNIHLRIKDYEIQ